MIWSLAPLRIWGARFGAALAAVTFLVILGSLFRVADVPSFVTLALFVFAVGSAFRPDVALAAMAAGVPVASWVGRSWNGAVAWPEAVAAAFCAGYCARSALARRITDRPADPLAGPVFLTVVIILASLAVQIWIDMWRFGAASTGRDLSDLISASYFVLTMSGDPIDATMRLLESLVLLKAAATEVQRKPKLASQLLGWAVFGAALAASLNVARVWQAAARLEAPLRSFASYFMNLRLNVHYGDLNAAGSYFVLLFFAAVGLALARKGRLYWGAVLLIASGIWISGSRTAIAVAMLAMVVPAAALGGTRIRQNGRRWVAIGGAALALVVVAAAVAQFSPKRGNQQSALAAIQVRVEMMRTSLLMTASSPSFGVGIGRYYFRSGEFSSPELLRLFPPAIHENAHNNFLQFLAELGVIGFGAVLWLLWTAARLCASLLARERQNPVAWGLVTGLLAFVLSWLGGHPLLIDEPAFTFWLLVGVVCGWATVVAPPAPSTPRTTWIVGALVALIAVSIPSRVVQQRANFDLEHRGIGVSHWQSAVDGVRFRLAGPTSSVFVPSAAQTLVIPLRTVSEVPQLRVEIRLDDRPADVVTVTNDRWHYLRLHMMRDRNPPRFRRLELRAPEASGDSPILMIGKVEPR